MLMLMLMTHNIKLAFKAIAYNTDYLTIVERLQLPLQLTWYRLNSIDTNWTFDRRRSKFLAEWNGMEI